MRTSYLFQIVRGHILTALGFEATLPSPDRTLLDSTILPALGSRPDITRILFVGTAFYTKYYAKFFPGKEFWTIDRVQRRARFGAGHRHIVDSVENVDHHFKPGALDLIVCNGVFGWGLNARDDVERAFGGFYECLRVGGLLLLGWDDVPEYRPFHPEETTALARFDHYRFEPLGTDRYAFKGSGSSNADRRSSHVFSFYEKRQPTKGPS